MENYYHRLLILNLKLFVAALLFNIAHTFAARPIPEKKICIVITSYNNINYYRKNLDSLIAQNYTNWHAVYVDDCSTDGTANAVEEYIKTKNLENRITLIKKTIRTGALESYYNVIHNCSNDTIIITYDGDDWLTHKEVLNRINHAYQNRNTWMTYGNYECYPKGSGKSWCDTLPAEVIKNSSYREYRWVTSQLRTFYAGLFKKIKKEDLMHNGAFFHVSWDLAFMFPMLEMAAGKVTFIKEILYIYNRETPINDYKLREKEMHFFGNLIRAKEKYQPVQSYRY